METQQQVPTRTLTRREVTLLVIAGVSLFGLYAATATLDGVQSNDSRSAAIAAWNLVAHGQLSFPVGWEPSRSYWSVPLADGGWASNRFPGVFLWAVPAYAIASGLGVLPAADEIHHPFLVPFAPAGLTAAAVTSAGIVVMYLVLRRLADPPLATAASVILAVGTPVWSVAADSLWPHGPTLLLLSLSLLATGDAHQRPVLAAGAAGGLVLTRPHLTVALIPQVLTGWRGRRRAETIATVAGIIVGTALLVAYSWTLFGTWLPVGGYDHTGFTQRLATTTPLDTARGLFSVFFDRNRGVLVLTPVVLVLLPWSANGWRAAPPWVRSAAVGGLVYLVLQVRMGRWTGGSGFAGYRTPLESLYLGVPLLVVTYRAATADRRWLRWLVAVAAAVAIAVTVVDISTSNASARLWWDEQVRNVADPGQNSR